MNNILKTKTFLSLSKYFKRHVTTSGSLYNRRPPHYLTKFKSKRFPYFNVAYDTDSAGPNKVVIDQLSSYPPGLWGSMPVSDAWKRHNEAKNLQNIPSYFDKLLQMSWAEYNMFYHTVDIPFLFPETLSFSQFLTRTKISYSVPDSIKDGFSNISVDNIKLACEYLKLQIDNYFNQNRKFIHSYDVESQKMQSDDFIMQFMDSIIRSRTDQEFLQNYTTSPQSKIETFIKRSGYNELKVPEHVKDAEGCIRYRLRGELSWTLRARDPLKEFVSREDPIFVNDGKQFPNYNYHPKTFDMEPKDYYIFQNIPFIHSRVSSEYVRNVPGFWGTNHIRPGDPCGFSVLGAFNTNLSAKAMSEFLPDQEIINRHNIANGILSGFTWTMAQAQNQGFTIYDEITYPFCSTLLLTDGCSFQLLYYQLNSISSLWKPEDAGLPVNMMWISPKMHLFKLNNKNQVEFINEHAVHQLLSCMSLPRSIMTSEELQPYLKTPAARDIETYIYDFDKKNSTERQVEEHKKRIKIRRVGVFSEPHPNFMFYLDDNRSLIINQEIRKIIPGIDKIPEKVSKKIDHYHLKRKIKIGRQKLMKYPTKWQ